MRGYFLIFLHAIADFIHPLSNNRSSFGMIGCCAVVWSAAIIVFQNMNYNLRKILSDVLRNNEVVKSLIHLSEHAAVPYQVFTTVSCSYHTDVLKTHCGETV